MFRHAGSFGLAQLSYLNSRYVPHPHAHACKHTQHLQAASAHGLVHHLAFWGGEKRWSAAHDWQSLQQQVHCRMALWCCEASPWNFWWHKDAFSLFADDPWCMFVWISLFTLWLYPSEVFRTSLRFVSQSSFLLDSVPACAKEWHHSIFWNHGEIWSVLATDSAFQKVKPKLVWYVFDMWCT